MLWCQAKLVQYPHCSVFKASLMSKKIVLATGNKGKVKELDRLLSPFNVEVIPQSQFDVPDVAETGTTFIENAIIKARHASKVTGLPAIADDSGLAVDALNGHPGIYSARYAGVTSSDTDNINKLLAELDGVPINERTARFHCVLVFMTHAEDPTPVICHGTWEGSINQELSGDNGFGYDPVFMVPGKNCTAAQLSAESKNQMSHRGKALALLIQKMKTMDSIF